MGFFQFVGCFLIAYTVPLVGVYHIVSIRSELVILSISAAFFWLLCIMMSSGLWAAFSIGDDVYIPLGAFVGVVCQELGRYCFYRLYSMAEVKVKKLREKSDGGIFIHPFRLGSSAIASGIGFGAMNAVVMFGPILASSGGNKTYYISSCSNLNIYVLTAITSMLYEILHIVMMYVAFHGYRSGNELYVALVVVLHLAASATTWINTSNHGSSCAASLTTLSALILASSFITYFIIGGRGVSRQEE
jgi:gamma-secretase subunit APH-1